MNQTNVRKETQEAEAVLRMGEIVGIIGGIMKVLIRDVASGLYVGRQAPWAGSLEAAAEFATLAAAGQKARALDGVDAVVVLRYESPERELALNPVYCVTDATSGDQWPRIWGARVGTGAKGATGPGRAGRIQT